MHRSHRNIILGDPDVRNFHPEKPSSGSLLCSAILLLLLFPLLTIKTTGQHIAINEIMASNSSVVSDEDGDHEDWIEIFNYGSEAIDLEGFFLSDDYSNPYKWVFPKIAIGPGSHLLVWASGKNRSEAGKPLHTNFSISRTGEEILLSNPDKIRIDEVAPTPISPEMAFGRYPDGTGLWGYMQHPSPGSHNAAYISESMLVHYFLFTSDLPNDTPLTTVDPNYYIVPGSKIQFESCLPAYPFEPGHPLWRKASMERRNRPTNMNYLPEGNKGQVYNDQYIRGLQIKQPFQKENRRNSLILHLPTSGFKNPLIRFAAMDEGAAEALEIDFAVTDEPGQWETLPAGNYSLKPDNYYRLYEIDFGEIPEASNNPWFRIRIQFGGPNMQEDLGKRVTLNNISLHGTPLIQHYIHSSSGNNGLIYPYGFTRLFEGESRSYYIYPTINHKIGEVLVDGTNLLDKVSFDDAGIGKYTINNVVSNHTITVSFTFSPEIPEYSKEDILVFPNPAGEIFNVVSKSVPYSVKLFDLSGKKVLSVDPATNQFRLEVRNLQPGIYILEVIMNGSLATGKVYVVR